MAGEQDRAAMKPIICALKREEMPLLILALLEAATRAKENGDRETATEYVAVLRYVATEARDDETIKTCDAFTEGEKKEALKAAR